MKSEFQSQVQLTRRDILKWASIGTSSLCLPMLPTKSISYNYKLECFQVREMDTQEL